MSLSNMQEAFIKAGLASKEKLEKEEQDRIKAQEKAKADTDERSRKIRAEKELQRKQGVPEGTLSPTQIENHRRVLFNMIGPAALILPVSEIQSFRDTMQKRVYDLNDKICPNCKGVGVKSDQGADVCCPTCGGKGIRE